VLLSTAVMEPLFAAGTLKPVFVTLAVTFITINDTTHFTSLIVFYFCRLASLSHYFRFLRALVCLYVLCTTASLEQSYLLFFF